MNNKLKHVMVVVAGAILAIGMDVAIFAGTQDPSGGGAPPAGARGQRGPRGGDMRGGPGAVGLPPAVATRLGLTGTQQDQIKAIGESHRAELRALADRAVTARQALDAAVMATTVDEATIRSKSAELAAVDADMAVARARSHAEIFQVLTPDQQKQLTDLQAQMRQRGGDRGPGGRGRRGPGDAPKH